MDVASHGRAQLDTKYRFQPHSHFSFVFFNPAESSAHKHTHTRHTHFFFFAMHSTVRREWVDNDGRSIFAMGVIALICIVFLCLCRPQQFLWVVQVMCVSFVRRVRDDVMALSGWLASSIVEWRTNTNIRLKFNSMDVKVMGELFSHEL